MVMHSYRPRPSADVMPIPPLCGGWQVAGLKVEAVNPAECRTDHTGSWTGCQWSRLERYSCSRCCLQNSSCICAANTRHCCDVALRYCRIRTLSTRRLLSKSL